MDTNLIIGTAAVALVVLAAITKMSSGPKAFTEEELAGPAPTTKKSSKKSAAAQSGEGKKKKKKKPLSGGKTLSSDLLDTPAPAEDDAKNSKKKAKKGAAKSEAPTYTAPKATITGAPVALKQSEIDDGWGVVVSKKTTKPKSQKKKKNDLSAAFDSPSPAPAPAPAKVSSIPAKAADAPDTQEIRIDGKKLGIVIGPAGATIKSIQESTGTRIELPERDGDEATVGRVNVTITGPSAGVKQAVKALTDLTSKGYSSVLEADNFTEGAISCPINSISELIGKRGVIIQAIQNHCEVRLNFPDTKNLPLNQFGKPKKSTVKVGIAGEKSKVTEAKKIMKEILKFHHHPVTHPGLSHVELDVPSSLYSIVIGPKGSAIKHIQNSFNVKVHIPGPADTDANILIVGAPSDNARAKVNIDKMIEKATAEPEEEEYVDETYDDRYDDEGPHEEWMNQYAPPPRRSGWQFN